MSALGQKQTCATQNGVSAFPPEADICSASAHVRYGLKADSGPRRQTSSLFDQLVSEHKQIHWYIEVERLAVAMLMTRSILLASSTGILAGVAPLRIRPA